ncbi:MAG: hypothetical protein LLF93_06130 [Bacteroidales bacterium]|nr:hypothetical protein [Bacteroidales bacterium]
MKWNNKKGDYIISKRTKTEAIRKNNIADILMPVDERLLTLINKVEDPNIPYSPTTEVKIII